MSEEYNDIDELIQFERQSCKPLFGSVSWPNTEWEFRYDSASDRLVEDSSPKDLFESEEDSEEFADSECEEAPGMSSDQTQCSGLGKRKYKRKPVKQKVGFFDQRDSKEKHFCNR